MGVPLFSSTSALMLILFVMVFGSMLVEARRAAANERAQLARGGIEAPGDVYPIMQVAYPAAFLLMFAEAVVRHPAPGLVGPGLLIWSLGKALKWWAIVSLGQFWTFRVIVVPGSTLVASGPYRLLRHPNYIGVVGELIGVALMTGATLAGPLVTLGFALLMRRRVSIENRALNAILRRG